MNLGIKFYTPEQFFLKASAEEYVVDIFNPQTVMSNIKDTDSPSKLFSPNIEVMINAL